MMVCEVDIKFALSSPSSFQYQIKSSRRQRKMKYQRFNRFKSFDESIEVPTWSTCVHWTYYEGLRIIFKFHFLSSPFIEPVLRTYITKISRNSFECLPNRTRFMFEASRSREKCPKWFVIWWEKTWTVNCSKVFGGKDCSAEESC